MTEITRLSEEELIYYKLDLLLKTGQLLVECAADTNRIMLNMKRAAVFLGFPRENLNISIQYNMLMVNLSDGEHSYSKIKTCDKHGINMTTLSAVSKLTWRAIKENLTIEDYQKELNRISNLPRNYKPWQVALGTGLACGGFSIQFGGDWIAFIYASFAAAFGMMLKHYLVEHRLNFYMSIAVSAFVSTFWAWLTTFLPAWSETPLHPLLACALFIVPGVPIINFVDDMLDNYIQVGLVRAINTFLMIVAMSFGIAFFLQLSNFDLKQFYSIPLIPHNNYISYAIAAAISAMGFSMIFNIPKRLLWVVAIGGIIAVCTRNFVNLGPSNDNIGLDMGLAIGSLVGSVVVSILAVKAVHWFNTPNHVLSIPCVIPMIPGVLMYRALIGLLEMHNVLGELTDAANFGMASAITILFISLGVAVPNVFARKWIGKERRLALRKKIEEGKEQGHFIDLSKL